MTFTARAGRCGTGPPPGTGDPVRGQSGWAIDDVTAVVLVVVVATLARWAGSGEEQAATTREAAAPPTSHQRVRRPFLVRRRRPAPDAVGDGPKVGSVEGMRRQFSVEGRA